MAVATSFNEANLAIGDTFEGKKVAVIYDATAGRYAWTDKTKSSFTAAPKTSVLYPLNIGSIAETDSTTVLTQGDRLLTGAEFTPTAVAQYHDRNIGEIGDTTIELELVYPLPQSAPYTLQIHGNNASGVVTGSKDIAVDGTVADNAVDVSELNFTAIVSDRDNERVIRIKAISDTAFTTQPTFRIWGNVIGNVGQTTFFTGSYAIDKVETINSDTAVIATIGSYHGSSSTTSGTMTWDSTPNTSSITKSTDGTTFTLQGDREYLIQVAFYKADASYLGINLTEDGTIVRTTGAGGNTHWDSGDSIIYRVSIPSGQTKTYTLSASPNGAISGFSAQLDIEVKATTSEYVDKDTVIPVSRNVFRQTLNSRNDGTVITDKATFTPNYTGTYIFRQSLGQTNNEVFAQLGTTDGGNELIDNNLTRLGENANRFTKDDEVSLTAGTTYHVVAFTGGGTGLSQVIVEIFPKNDVQVKEVDLSTYTIDPAIADGDLITIDEANKQIKKSTTQIPQYDWARIPVSNGTVVFPVLPEFEFKIGATHRQITVRATGADVTINNVVSRWEQSSEGNAFSASLTFVSGSDRNLAASNIDFGAAGAQETTWFEYNGYEYRVTGTIGGSYNNCIIEIWRKS